MAQERLPSQENIKPVKIEEEMQRSYIDYAMSVIVGRALPDVRDGLKPVHRRILYAMYELSNTSDKPHKKSARIVGEVLGKYHPHGDIAIYDSLVRMAQDFSMRYPLIDGQGNFGSVDGDSPAAMRYTEARLAKIAEELLQDLEKETVDFVPNFDDSLQEPSVLPAKLPNLLLNGSSGIAVGMATNIPPHNLGEVVDALVILIERPQAALEELMTVLKGPDFPTGGFIVGREGIGEAYATGRGTLRLRAKAAIEKKKDRDRIIITEIPYMVNKAKLIEAMAELVKEKKIEGIADLRDESDREGMRIVLELKGSAVPEVILNQLYKHTQMETTFGVINLALVDGEPKVLNLQETLHQYIKYRTAVVRRRSQFELRKAEKRAHILEGLKAALGRIDAVIKLIKASKTPEQARNALVADLKLSQEQAQAILEMRLQRLTGLEREKIDQEHLDLQKQIARLKTILGSEGEILSVIKGELAALKKEYGDPRRTAIVEATPEIRLEDLIPKEETVIMDTNSGYIKRIPLTTYRMQRRGGKGIIGIETKEEDYIVDLFVTSTHDYVLFFSNMGKVYRLKAYEIPEGSRYSKGKAIINILPKLEAGERINATIPVKEFDDAHYLVFATKRGVVKKTVLSAFSNIKVSGIRAINLDQGDELIGTKLSDGNREIVLATSLGKAVRFSEGLIRGRGRAARGVAGVRLSERDEVVSMTLGQEGMILLTVSQKGYGKRTPLSEYRKTGRNAKGVVTMKANEKTGKVISVLEVSGEDELIVTSKEGMVIRIPVRG
ncbi:MAG: DNA gyrase subunit A, partial [Candidatus Hydrothermarchaeota archaeon]